MKTEKITFESMQDLTLDELKRLQSRMQSELYDVLKERHRIMANILFLKGEISKETNES